MKYIIYFFDFDYILVDFLCGIVICFCNVLECYGYMGISDEVIKCIIGKILEDLFSILSGIIIFEILVEYKKEYVKEVDIYMIVNIFFFFEMVIVLKILKS